MILLTGCSVKWADNIAYKGHLKENINEYDKAIRLYNKAIRFNKGSALAYWRRAFWYYNNEEYQKSIDDLDNAIKIDSTFNSGYLFGDRADSKVMLADYGGAISDYTIALALCKIEPDRPSTPKENFFFYRSKAYLHVSDTVSALIDLDSAIYYWDKFPRALLLRAQLKAKLQRYDEAMLEYKSYPLDEGAAEFDYYADDFYYQGLSKFKTGDSTYCHDWAVAASHKFEPAIRELERYCKK
jgi:tetratricopeptide (TPR) repeat protein